MKWAERKSAHLAAANAASVVQSFLEFAHIELPHGLPFWKMRDENLGRGASSDAKNRLSAPNARQFVTVHVSLGFQFGDMKTFHACTRRNSVFC
jgi:hypothetical protein